MKFLVASVIKILHLLFIMFIFTFWTSNDIMELILYAITVLTLQVHWVSNNDTCALTIIEQKLTGKTDKKETFFGKLVSPIYIMENDFQNQISYFITSILVIIVLYKLHFNNNSYKILKQLKSLEFYNCVKLLK